LTRGSSFCERFEFVGYGLISSVKMSSVKALAMAISSRVSNWAKVSPFWRTSMAKVLCPAAVDHGGQRAPAAGAHPTPGGNSQRAPDAHGGGRSHGQLARPALGAVARRCLRRITRGARGDRTVSGRFALVALPRPLPAAACLPRRRHHRQLLAACGQEESPMPKSKHPRRSKPIASAPDHPWRNLGSGHFYPAENRTFLLCVDSSTLA
jgi:hypothetical protein